MTSKISMTAGAVTITGAITMISTITRATDTTTLTTRDSATRPTDMLPSFSDLNPRSCDLCPRRCGANRAAGERGACGAADDVLIARAALHFWEEPPISGSAGSGTVFFAHCPLRCSYCQNTVIAHGSLGYAVKCVDLRDACLDLERQGALNVNFVTPTHYAPHVRAAVLAAREEGFSLPVVWNTGGYETVEAIRANTDVVDVYLTDLKYADPALGVRYSSVSDYPQRALEALAAMIDEVGSPVYDKYRGRTYDARRHRSPFAAPRACG